MKLLCVASAIVCATVLAAHGQETYRRTQDLEWKIAHRMDDGRMVVTLRDGADVSASEREVMLGAEFSKPTARYIDRLWHAPVEWVQRSTGTTMKRGDALVVDAGRAGWVDASVEEFVFAGAGCDGAGGILAAVAPSQAASFSKVKERYFPVRAAAGWIKPQGLSLAGPVSFNAGPGERRTIERLLAEEFVRTSAPLLDEEERYSHRALTPPWRIIYKRLANGEGRLRYDIQAFRLTPDGAPRLFVRASWTLDHRQVYMMGAWMRTSPNLSIDGSDVHAARYAWSPNMFESLDLFWNGRVLNVTDIDRDGTAEVLMLFEGYEGVSIQLKEYPPVIGAKVLATFGAGC